MSNFAKPYTLFVGQYDELGNFVYRFADVFATRAEVVSYWEGISNFSFRLYYEDKLVEWFDELSGKGSVLRLDNVFQGEEYLT